MANHFALNARKIEAIDEFEFILETYILPLLQTNGDLIKKIEPTTSSDLKKHVKCYSKGGENYLYFFPALSTPQFHFRIKTTNPNQELGAAENVLSEILRVSNFDFRSNKFNKTNYYDKNNIYRNARFNVALEIGLCSWLGSECIYDLIQRLREWSQKTYEGSHMAFGFIIDSTKTTTGVVDYLNFLKSNHSAVFTDGMSSGIKLDHKGRIVKYFSAMQGNSSDTKTPWTPYEFIDFTKMCKSEAGSNWIGIIMQSNGDMLIFKSQQLVFVKRNGKWMYLDSYTIHSTIKSRYSSQNDSVEEADKKKFADEVYLSVLDTSFAHTGGCIAIVDDEYIDTVKNKCFPKDSLDSDDPLSEKKTIIKRLISTGTIDGEKQYFQYLDRKLRLELLSLDGATVLDSSGRILCVGAIVKIDGGSDGGGRLAATTELAKYGLAMKISMDGSIQCFVKGNDGELPKEIFKTL